MSRNIILAAVAVLLVMSSGCDSTKSLEREEANQIQNYLGEHPDLHYIKKESGLYYLDDTVGTGPLAMTHDTAYIFYRGSNLSETGFNTNIGSTDTLIRPVNEGWFIKGFDEALTYMRVGGKAKVIVPSYLGYQDYNPLLFDIYLVKLVPGPGAKGK
jgi:FKBP-type peptidyl-prolyl cis-trans isomerase FkpA